LGQQSVDRLCLAPATTRGNADPYPTGPVRACLPRREVTETVFGVVPVLAPDGLDAAEAARAGLAMYRVPSRLTLATIER
jgi:hypothetical protein